MRLNHEKRCGDGGKKGEGMSQVLLKEIAELIRHNCSTNCGLEPRGMDNDMLCEEAKPFVELFMRWRDQPDLFEVKP